MGKKTNKIQKKNRRLAKNKTSGVKTRMYIIEAYKDIVSIQELLSQIEEVLQEEINNPNSEDSSFNKLTCMLRFQRVIELISKLKKHGHHKLIDSKISTKLNYCIKLLERVPDDEDEQSAVEQLPSPTQQNTYRYLRCSQIESADDDPEYIVSPKKPARMRYYNEPAWFSDD